MAELGALAAVVDHHAPVAEAVAARLGCRALALKAALEDAAVTAVAVATQPRQHHAVGMAALAAGKHLLVEKPLTLDMAEARALVAAARARSRVLMVGHILRYHAAFVALEGLVGSAALGRLLRIEARRMSFGPLRADEDVLWCLAPHDVSMTLALMGGPPRTVEALAAHPVGRPIADTATLQLGFGSGATALIDVSWLHPVKVQRLTVIGTAAIAVFDDRAPWEGKLTVYPSGIRTGSDGPSLAQGDPLPQPLVPAEPLRAECLHFLDCVRSGGEPRTGGAEALGVMDVLARAARAMAWRDQQAEAQ